MNSDSIHPSSLDVYFRDQSLRLETALDQFLPKPTQHLSQIQEAMRYAVLNGGKRIRPLLCLAVSDLFRGDSNEGLIMACAIELIHCYSLVHDDLPCLDNDEFRRGKLTCHKKFGEAIALLAGDALLTLAFQLVGKLQNSKKVHRILKELGQAAGTLGMVGGQVMELVVEKGELDLPTLEAIHIQKTGQLIKVSCLSGAVLANAKPEEEAHILKFGEYLGFAFQIVDDILDGDGYLRFMSAHEAKEKAAEIVAKAKQEILAFKNNERLLQIADFILERASEQHSL